MTTMRRHTRGTNGALTPKQVKNFLRAAYLTATRGRLREPTFSCLSQTAVCVFLL